MSLIILIVFFNNFDVLIIVFVVFVNIFLIIGMKFFVINLVVFIVILLVIVVVVFCIDNIFKKIVKKILIILMLMFCRSLDNFVILYWLFIVFIIFNIVVSNKSGRMI